jgi:hypothetical protein
MMCNEAIRPIHISLYIAMFMEWSEQGSNNFIYISRKKLMQYSKIHSIVSYHRALNTLVACKYLDYYPSFIPQEGKGTKIFLRFPENEDAI